jgi:hypothetical protein
VPVIDGVTVFAGEAATTAVCTELAFALPEPLVAVTRIRIVEPASAETRVYVEVVAPVMSMQLPPDASHRRHW